MNEYLTKPLDKKSLLAMVHKCATTIPVLHPNISKIVEITPDNEQGNPLDNANWNSGVKEGRYIPLRRQSQGDQAI